MKLSWNWDKYFHSMQVLGIDSMLIFWNHQNLNDWCSILKFQNSSIRKNLIFCISLKHWTNKQWVLTCFWQPWPKLHRWCSKLKNQQLRVFIDFFTITYFQLGKKLSRILIFRLYLYSKMTSNLTSYLSMSSRRQVQYSIQSIQPTSLGRSQIQKIFRSLRNVLKKLSLNF